jgi:hypothetical protein
MFAAVSRIPHGDPSTNAAPKKIKTLPPRYRGFLEKRNGPDVISLP